MKPNRRVERGIVGYWDTLHVYTYAQGHTSSRDFRKIFSIIIQYAASRP